MSGLRRGSRPGVWSARCPVHDDRAPSLSVRVGHTGVLLLTCHVCKSRFGHKEFLDQVSRATGTDPRDWCSAGGPRRYRKAQTMSRITRTFDYVDQHGELKFQVCRLAGGEPKCLARRPAMPDDPPDKVKTDAGGSWVWEAPCNDVAVPGLLYRLPDLLDRPDQPVCIPEGEPDCDTLAALGFVAVTNAFGACNWIENHAAWLKGRRCVIFEDNDVSGRRRTELVLGTALRWGAASVKLVRFDDQPEKSDVSDWLALPENNAKSIAEKRALVIERVRQAMEWKPTIAL